jgi:ABC-type branched-subunit amino acid transport system permease subunit
MNSRRKLQARAKVLGQSSQKNKYIMLTVPVMIAAIAGRLGRWFIP